MRLALILGLALALCAPFAAADEITQLIVTSPAGDYIGQGQSYTLTPADGVFDATTNFDNGVTVTLHNSDYSMWWQLDFAAKQNAPLAVGSYPNAIRFPSPWLPDSNQVQASTTGRTCNTLTGDFEIKYLAWDSPTQVRAFWAVLHQSCEGFMPALTVEIIYRMDSTVPVRPATWGTLKTLYR